MVEIIGFVLAAVILVVIVEKLSHRYNLPGSVLMTVVGLVYALLPGPNVTLRPEVVLYLVIPPLLYNAALGSSLLAIRSRLRTVVSLSVLLVLVTALAIGGMLYWLVPAIPLAAGVALGAAVAPPDPVAALSIGRRAGLPGKLSTLIEGEGLLNDATALTTFSVAVAAVSGHFSFGLAVGEFALEAVGGVAIGVVLALVVRVARRLLSDPLSNNAISLVVPFAAYAIGEAAYASGVLAVVVAGLIIGHQNPRLQTGASRLQTSAVWQLVNFLLEGLVFLLIGMQLPEVVRGLGAYATSTVVLTGVITVGVALLIRPLWLVVTNYGPRRLHTRLGGVPESGESQPAVELPLSRREIVAMSWSGTRGVITLAITFAIPRVVESTGQPFPARDLLLFAAYLLVLVTLLGQGLTFGPLLRKLRVRANPRDEARLRNQARAAAMDAAMARLDQLTDEEQVPEKVIGTLKRSMRLRQQRYHDRLSFLQDESAPLRSPDYQAAIQARRAVLEAQHEELLRWRDAGRLPDSSLRLLQRELDHEERTLPMPESSG